MSYPGLDKTLETLSRYNELSSHVLTVANEVTSKLPRLLADTSKAYEALSKIDWETLQAKALDEARLKTIEELAALIKKKPQDVIWSGLVSAIGDGLIKDKTGRFLEQADFLSYQDSKYILNCYPQDENDTQVSIYIPEAKRHSLFAIIAKAYATWLGLKIVFLKEFSKVLELVKEQLLTLTNSFIDTIKSKDNSPPKFIISFSISNNAPPKNNGKPFSALLFLSCVSNSRKELIA